jgi:hypothetical protein
VTYSTVYFDLRYVERSPGCVVFRFDGVQGDSIRWYFKCMSAGEQHTRHFINLVFISACVER